MMRHLVYSITHCQCMYVTGMAVCLLTYRFKEMLLSLTLLLSVFVCVYLFCVLCCCPCTIVMVAQQFTGSPLNLLVANGC